MIFFCGDFFYIIHKKHSKKININTNINIKINIKININMNININTNLYVCKYNTLFVRCSSAGGAALHLPYRD